ncbi:hypothetical protein [Parasitella parasitica]|uniref:Uncharacterized protein n=1 Tax=Parasitella parasitica TaxID=35722 RepID=A0A0B7NKW5_9FUNG|nr:hypothetical protein [Parasitella parasitica]
MCLPSACILATPYSTGDNEGSTCAVTNQPYGYDFYNYCLSSGLANSGDEYEEDIDDEDYCNTSTACYPYRQGDLTQQHIWNNLTCNDACQLVSSDGSPPPIPIPITNISSVTTSTHHPSPGSMSSGNANPRRNQFDPRTRSPTSIALVTVCSIVSAFLAIWLVRIVFYKTRYWPWINKYLFCNFCRPAIVPLQPSQLTSSLTQCTTAASTPNSRPPSFQSNNIIYPSMRLHNSSSSNSSNSSLPSYYCQDPSLPKYEQAIVTQIRGMSFFDHHPSSSPSSSTQQQQQQQHQQQPIWVPVYLSTSPINNSTIVRSPILNSFLPLNADWARPVNIRHQPSLTRSQTSLSIEQVAEPQDDGDEDRGRSART